MFKKIRRRNYLIKKGLQLKYGGVAFLTTLFITLVIMLYMAWNVEQLAYLTTKGGFSIQQALSVWKSAFLLKLGLLLFVLLILNIVVSILISHKVAGVIFRLEKIVDNVTKGDFSSELHTRKGDELTNLVKKFNQMLVSLRTKATKNKKVSQRLRSLCEDLSDKLKQDSVSGENLNVHIDKLKQIQNELEKLI